MSESEYERGHIDGEIAARLAQHDAHFTAINGSVDRLATAVEVVGGKVDEIRIVQRERDTRWTPIQKAVATVGAFLTAIASVTGAVVVIVARH